MRTVHPLMNPAQPDTANRQFVDPWTGKGYEKGQTVSSAWILGAGKSGVAASRLLASQGAAIRLVDDDEERAADAMRRVLAEFPGAHEFPPDATPDIAVTSPGLAPDSAPRRLAADRGIPVISEIDVSLPNLRCTFVGVTGSKGKSSLVKLIADTLERGGHRAVPCGNYGTPLAEVALSDPQPDVAVVECSSFQLETTRAFRPAVGIFLNLSPDHLARHGGMDGYRDAKMRLFQAQTPDDTALFPSTAMGDSLRERHRALGFRGRVATFGAEASADWRWTPGMVTAPDRQRLPIAGSYFDNAILGPAAAAGAAAALLLGVPADTAAAAIREFAPLPHRMELVRTLRGVRYVNDSKATSLTALRAGVAMAGGPVLLVAGGRLKENDLDIAKELMTSGVKKVYLIGESADRLAAAWSPPLLAFVCGTLENAVARAAADAQEGDVVLLSPGTASFDQFRSFEERGARFAELILHLPPFTPPPNTPTPSP